MAFDFGAAGIGQAKHFGGFVEGFAERIVDCGAEPDIIADTAYHEQLAVAARGEQQEIRKVEAVGETRGQSVRFEVIDGDEGLARDERERFGGCQADHNPADKARASGGGDAVEVAEFHAGGIKCAFNEDIGNIDMGAGGNFRDNAAIGLMLGDLAQNLVGQNMTVPVMITLDDRGGGFIAGGFNTENAHAAPCLRR